MQTPDPIDSVSSPQSPPVQPPPIVQPSISESAGQREMFSRAQRRKLPDERKTITHKVSVGGHESHIVVDVRKKLTKTSEI